MDHTHQHLPRLTLRTLQEGVGVLCGQDADLRGIVERFGTPPLWARRPGFATLLRIVLEQQVSLASARALHGRLEKRVGKVTPEAVEALGESGLRALGFTRQKAAYCVGLSAALLANHLDPRALSRVSDDVARAALVRVRGLGRWTADIYLLMALRRTDVWPAGDLALAEAVRDLRGLPARPSVAELDALAADWSPWRAVAARILWHHHLSTRKRPVARHSSRS